jgi:hypothetical protein
MTEGASFTSDEAKQIGSDIGVDWTSAPFDVEQFRMVWMSNWSMAVTIPSRTSPTTIPS